MQVSVYKTEKNTGAVNTAGMCAEPSEKEQAFRALIKGEYKNEYAKEFQKVFDRRFKDVKSKLEAYDSFLPVIEALAKGCGVAESDTGALLAAVEKLSEVRKYER